jgi:predicted nucleic acid-binding protein
VVADHSSHNLIVDASPLIYLAKLDALDVFRGGMPVAISEGVRSEVLLPQAAYRFPEIVGIDESMRAGRIMVVSLDKRERDSVNALTRQVPGLGRGELETIAIARSRGWTAALADRRATRIAEIHGVAVIGIVELLFARTRDSKQLAGRIRNLAKLVNMRIETLDRLLGRVREGAKK